MTNKIKTDKLIKDISALYIGFNGKIGKLEEGGGLIWQDYATQLPNPLLRLSHYIGLPSGLYLLKAE